LILSDHVAELRWFCGAALGAINVRRGRFLFSVTNSRGREMAIETFESGADGLRAEKNLGKLVPRHARCGKPRGARQLKTEDSVRES